MFCELKLQSYFVFNGRLVIMQKLLVKHVIKYTYPTGRSGTLQSSNTTSDDNPAQFQESISLLLWLSGGSCVVNSGSSFSCGLSIGRIFFLFLRPLVFQKQVRLQEAAVAVILHEIEDLKRKEKEFEGHHKLRP